MVYIITAYLKMLMEGEGRSKMISILFGDICWLVPLLWSRFFQGIFASWVPYYDLDSCRGHLLIGANFFSSVELLTWDLSMLVQGERTGATNNSWFRMTGQNWFSMKVFQEFLVFSEIITPQTPSTIMLRWIFAYFYLRYEAKN